MVNSMLSAKYNRLDKYNVVSPNKLTVAPQKLLFKFLLG